MNMRFCFLILFFCVGCGDNTTSRSIDGQDLGAALDGGEQALLDSIDGSTSFDGPSPVIDAQAERDSGRPTNACASDSPGKERPVGWLRASHCKGEDPQYELVFDDTQVRRMDIAVSPVNYQATMTNLASILDAGDRGPLDGTEEPMYVPVQVMFNGQTWWDVGMRYKGNSSLHSAWRSGIRKLAFRFNFDKFEDDNALVENQRFYGFKKMTFSSGFKDDSLIRDKLAADIFRQAGVPAAHSTFIRVYVDHGEGPQYFGLYTMIEDPSDEMLDHQFSDGSGNLYKPEGQGATWQRFVEASFAKKTNEEAGDFSDIIAAIDALHANVGDRSSWRDGLESVFDVRAFLRCLAVNQVMVNWDSYGIMDHNYYVYGNPADGGRLVWFPWDLNEALLVSGRSADAATSVMRDGTSDRWPLIRFLLDDPVYREFYKDEVRIVLEGAFAVDGVHEALRRLHGLIAPYVIGPESVEAQPYTFLSDSRRFENALTNGRDGLLRHVEMRHQDARAALAAD